MLRAAFRLQHSGTPPVALIAAARVEPLKRHGNFRASLLLPIEAEAIHARQPASPQGRVELTSPDEHDGVAQVDVDRNVGGGLVMLEALPQRGTDRFEVGRHLVSCCYRELRWGIEVPHLLRQFRPVVRRRAKLSLHDGPMNLEDDANPQPLPVGEANEPRQEFILIRRRHGLLFWFGHVFR